LAQENAKIRVVTGKAERNISCRMDPPPTDAAV
jgi:hypothetical protein